MWLGDGSSASPAITNIDPEVTEYCRAYAETLGLNFNQVKKKDGYAPTYGYSAKDRKQGNTVLVQLRNLGVYKNKHIPKSYLENSREARLQLLAGIIDTDGYLTNEIAYELVQKSERIYDDVRQLCHSLGFRMTKEKKMATCDYKGEKKYCLVYRGRITSVHLSDIPVKIARKKILRKPHSVFLSKFTISNSPDSAE